MNKRLLNLKDVINGENKTISVTRTKLKGIYDNWPRFINVLLQLMYFTGEHKDPTTPEGAFHSFAWHGYLEAPYSFRALSILYERGYYLNAAILYRTLLEAFIQCRYLFKHKQQTDNIWQRKKCEINGKKRIIRIKDMFDEVSPGFYKVFYGRLLAGMAHGKISAHLFRIKRKSMTEGRIISIPEYNENGATYIIHNTNALLYGYMNYFPIFFQEGYNKGLGKLRDEYNYSMRWLLGSMKQHKEVNPKSIEWYQHIDKIINRELNN